MRDQLLQSARAAEAVPGAASDTGLSHGIGFPRHYDLLLLILTRGRERAYREDVLDLAGVAPDHHVLDIGCGTGTQAIAAWRRSQPEGDNEPSNVAADQTVS